jgi:hypothetical protein
MVVVICCWGLPIAFFSLLINFALLSWGVGEEEEEEEEEKNGNINIHIKGGSIYNCLPTMHMALVIEIVVVLGTILLQSLSSMYN